MNIEDLYNIFLKYPVISTDSRDIKENCLFFALKGEKFDGNIYAKEALEKGAKYSIISDKNFFLDKRTILVDDTQETLQNLAKFHRENLPTKIIAITGSNGKTTTKELLASVLRKNYNTLATHGNFNNHIGVPLTLLGLTYQIEIAVIEMGANHIGEIADLCKIASPDVAIITNIGKAHLEGFGSIENLINTKLALFEFVNSKNGIILLNKNDIILKEKEKNFKNVIKYGNCEDCIVKVVKTYNETFLKLEVQIKNKIFEIATNLIGKYNTDNVLAAITTGLFFDIEIENIIEGIKEYVPSNHRSQLFKTEKNTLILDMYNANPTSMNLSIKNFAEIDLTEKVLVIGDMLELGTNEKKEHQEIIDMIKKYDFKNVYIIGKIFSSCQYPQNFKSFENVEAFNTYLKSYPIKNCSILLKASNGTGLKKCLDFL